MNILPLYVGLIVVASNGDHSFRLAIYELNDEDHYNEVRASISIGNKYKFSSYTGSIANDIKAWELTKW